MDLKLNGVKVVAKFFLSKDPNDNWKCISRTLGKLAIPDASNENEVKDQEIWLCEIKHETKPGKNYGVFVLSPISKIEPQSIKKLIPGFYEETPLGRAVMLTPKENPQDHWMVSVATRKIFSEKYHTIVVPCSSNEV